jgi:hypothetical protein
MQAGSPRGIAAGRAGRVEGAAVEGDSQGVVLGGGGVGIAGWGAGTQQCDGAVRHDSLQ